MPYLSTLGACLWTPLYSLHRHQTNVARSIVGGRDSSHTHQLTNECACCTPNSILGLSVDLDWPYGEPQFLVVVPPCTWVGMEAVDCWLLEDLFLRKLCCEDSFGKKSQATFWEQIEVNLQQSYSLTSMLSLRNWGFGFLFLSDRHFNVQVNVPVAQQKPPLYYLLAINGTSLI